MVIPPNAATAMITISSTTYTFARSAESTTATNAMTIGEIVLSALKATLKPRIRIHQTYKTISTAMVNKI